MDTKALIAAETTRWDNCLANPNRVSAAESVARRLCASNAKTIYQRIQARTGVPWWIVAVIHEREASQNFSKQLGQGDPLSIKSVHVPKGWGPYTGPDAFENAAYDALMKAAPKAGLWTDWSVGGSLVILMMYNGLGYANRGRPSPYLWAGTNQYQKGKYVADGKYDPEAVDTQLGCAIVLVEMMKLDRTIAFGVVPHGAPPPPTVRVEPKKPDVAVVPSPSIVPDQGPSISHPAAGSLGDAIVKIFTSLFSHLQH